MYVFFSEMSFIKMASFCGRGSIIVHDFELKQIEKKVIVHILQMLT